MKRNPTYVLIEAIRQGNVDGRQQLTFVDLALLRAALQRVLLSSDLSNVERIKNAKLLEKIMEVSK